MEYNANFSERVLVRFNGGNWQASPMAGVDRHMLDRIGDEVARATTIVRYAKGSSFSEHTHDGGEEFIVLDGIFQDEHGDYPAGSYIRNPPTSHHIPRSDEGCTIFVKLWQFDPDDRTQVKIDMSKMQSISAANRKGVSIMPLFQDARETVQMEVWDADSEITIDLPHGGEFLVLDGSFTESNDIITRHDWLRIPVGGAFHAKAGQDGAKVWIKTGHLRYVKAIDV